MNSPIAVQVKDLTVRFGDFTAVQNISFIVPQGEIFGFLGSNGAGKTTTIRALCGLLRPTSGQALVAGFDADQQKDEVKKRIGYMSQKFTLYTDLTVEENLLFAARLRRLPPSYFEERKKKLMDFVGFHSSPRILVRDLAGGVKQELSLVAAILHDPQIVFLGEPTAGVSPTSRSRFWALINQLSQNGKTVFVTTHYMDEAEECGRIALMRTGQIIALDSPSYLKEQAFSDPLYEVEPSDRKDLSWIKILEGYEFVKSFRSHGLRYHALITNDKAFREFATKHHRDFSIQRISPSLEDVFIHLVEGNKP